MARDETLELRELAASLGVPLERNKADLMLEHLDLLLRETEVHNLTAVCSPDEALRIHCLDSLTPWLLRSRPVRRMADVGSGGGYPGIPLGILLGGRTTLIESRQKKARFLCGALDELGLGGQFEVFAGRSELLACERPGLSDYVIARAVARVPVLLELMRPLLIQGGHAVLMKGDPEQDELAAGAEAAGILGFELAEELRVTLPSGGETRTLLDYVVRADSALDLPRREGVAAKRPIA